jgi:hypothetical protein
MGRVGTVGVVDSAQTRVTTRALLAGRGRRGDVRSVKHERPRKPRMDS